VQAIAAGLLGLFDGARPPAQPDPDADWRAMAAKMLESLRG
jgi:hypothetical protein